MNLKERIKTFIKHLSIDVKTFETKCELSNGFVNNIGQSIREKSMGQILSVYPDLNRNWILTGEGNMLKSEVKSNALDLGDLPSNFELDDTPHIDLPGGDILLVFPLVSESAYAGYAAGYSDPEYIEQLPKHSIIVQEYHKGKYRGFEVVGDSMDDGTIKSIPDKSRVTGRFLMHHHWKNKLHLHRYTEFVIVRKDDGIQVKKIIKHDVENGIITCHSTNPDKDSYPDFEVNLEDVQELYNVIDVSIRR
ncbi:S24 family peptidase [Pedobacter cryoconitis]|nr:peptidase S24 [Pedobacter cryoconitis]